MGEIGKKIQHEAYMQDLLHVLKSLWGLCCLDMTEENREEARQNYIVLDPSVHDKFNNYKKEFEAMLTFLPECRQTYLQTFDYRKAKDPNFMKGFGGKSCAETVTAADTSGRDVGGFPRNLFKTMREELDKTLKPNLIILNLKVLDSRQTIIEQNTLQ